MNIVPLVPGQGGIRAFVQNALRAGRMLGPAAMNEAMNLARRHGPDAYAWVRREVLRGGRRIFRGLRRREHGPMANQNRGPYQLGPTQFFSQYRGSRGTVSARRRGGQGMRRGGRYLPRLRTGGRRIANYGPRPELKAYDKGANSVALQPTISYITEPFNDLPIGPNANNRIGRKIRTKSLLLVGSVKTVNVTSITTASDTVWIWVVLDRQANTTVPLVTDIWSNTTGHGALRNLDGGPRFKILKCVECKVDYGQSGVDVNVPFEQFLRINKQVHFKNTGGTTPERNNILIFAGTANSNNTTLVMDIYTRLRYTDV